MSEQDSSLLDMFIFETSQNTEQLEKIILNGERTSGFSQDEINEIFRIMHTIKGSAAMMSYTSLSSLAHKVEDLFFFIREHYPLVYDCSLVSDLVLEAVDFINGELEKIKEGTEADSDAGELIAKISDALDKAKSSQGSDEKSEQPEEKKVSPKKDKTPEKDKASGKNESSKKPADTANAETPKNMYKTVFFFQEGCEMENIRAFNIVFQLKNIASDISYIPSDIDEGDNGTEEIKKNGFMMFFRTDKDYDYMNNYFTQQAFMKDFELVHYETEKEYIAEKNHKKDNKKADGAEPKASETSSSKEEGKTENKTGKQENKKIEEVNAKINTAKKEQNNFVTQSIISVDVEKLDKLMDMIGELVIAESMVIHNPDLKDLQLEGFNKSAHQLHKITNELQDLAMSVRMVPLTNTFQKMNRIVRDMSKKLKKDVKLEMIGGETEVDKNIIDHLSDPLMHLVRNCLDHGIESPEERLAEGKSKTGTVTLEAKNEGGEIHILVKDDGKGLDKEKILKKAKEHELLTKPENEMTDREIFSLIFLPGFSTNDKITEYSGRGVGMDVVVRNIEELGGRVTVESAKNRGSLFTMRFPMTLAIIEGMNMRVGNSVYTIPITAIRESIRPDPKDIIRDPMNNEMMMYRGECYPILRLHEIYNIKADHTDISEGIIVMIENGDRMVCLFIDELLGQNQVVVKPLPAYIKKINGIAGCTILGDGDISLILDAGGLVDMKC